MSRRRVTINRKLNRVTVTTKHWGYRETNYYTIDEWKNRHKIANEKRKEQNERLWNNKFLRVTFKALVIVNVIVWSILLLALI